MIFSTLTILWTDTFYLVPTFITQKKTLHLLSCCCCSQFCEQILSIWFPLSLLKRKPCIYWAVSTNSPFPMALETTNPFFAAMVCLFQVFHINGILLSVTFNARFLSFCIFSRLIHVVACVSISFLLTAE